MNLRGLSRGTLFFACFASSVGCGASVEATDDDGSVTSQALSAVDQEIQARKDQPPISVGVHNILRITVENSAYGYFTLRADAQKGMEWRCEERQLTNRCNQHRCTGDHIKGRRISAGPIKVAFGTAEYKLLPRADLSYSAYSRSGDSIKGGDSVTVLGGGAPSDIPAFTINATAPYALDVDTTNSKVPTRWDAAKRATLATRSQPWTVAWQGTQAHAPVQVQFGRGWSSLGEPRHDWISCLHDQSDLAPGVTSATGAMELPPQLLGLLPAGHAGLSVEGSVRRILRQGEWIILFEIVQPDYLEESYTLE